MEQELLKEIVREEFNDENDVLCAFSSSSSSSDEDEEVAIKLSSLIKNKRTSIHNFYEEVIERYSSKEFLSHFRVDREVVYGLTQPFAASECYMGLLRNANCRTNINPEKHVLVFLWFAGHQTASFRDVADRFNLSLSSLFDVITRISKFLSSMASSIIKLPSQAARAKTADFYFNKNGFPNIIGSVDGTHIKIDKPHAVDRPVDYYNRKDYYSIHVQGLCNENLDFIDIFIGYPGSVHDARVFRNSSLFSKMEELCNGYYILGDSAYPLLPQVIVPYRDNGHLTAAQKYFNTKLSSCRVSIEHCFGLLKQRFRQLYHLKLRGHERICHFIRACCVLHNIANKNDTLLFNEEVEIIDIQPDNPEVAHVQAGAADKRHEICQQLLLSKTKKK